MCLQSIPRQQIDGLLFQVLKRVYLWEREIDSIFGLTYQDIYLLQHLRKASPCCISDIASELSVPLFQSTRLAARLEKCGYIAKEKKADDRRSVWVSLLPAGEDVLLSIEKRSYELILNNSAELPIQEVQSFLKAAENIDRILRLSHE
jgi:DNA-binding MarR family transcriptional regulator